MAKTPNIAKMVATKARGKVAMLQRNLDNDDYDETELRHAITHAKKMLRIAKKKMRHLEEETEAKQKSGAQIQDEDNGIPDLPDEEEKEQEQKEMELDQAMQEYQDIVSEFMTKAMNEMMNQMMNEMMEDTQLEELADAFMGDVSQVEDLEPEDLEKIKKKHRSDELREIMEADMKYLKAMINKLERERQELSTQNFSAPSVTLEISGVQMPVQTMEAPVTPEGEVIDVSL